MGWKPENFIKDLESNAGILADSSSSNTGLFLIPCKELASLLIHKIFYIENND